MGNTFALGLDDVVPLVDPPQQHVAEVNRPDPVVDLLEADGVLFERVGEEQQPLPQADGAGVGHALDEEVPGVLDGRQRAGVRPRGSTVQRRRRPIVQRLMGPLLVVEVAEGVEGALLSGEVRVRRATGLAPLRVLCIRSCAPFCWGWAGRIRWCWIPRRSHQTLSCDSP